MSRDRLPMDVHLDVFQLIKAMDVLQDVSQPFKGTFLCLLFFFNLNLKMI